MRRKSLGAVLVVLVAASAGAPWLASARHMAVTDPKDTDGLLDVRRVNNGGKVTRPYWKIVTFKRWSNQRIFDRGYFVIYLDLRGDSFYEHYIVVRSEGSRIRALLYRDRKNKPAYLLRRAAVWRREDNSVTVRLAIGNLVGAKRVTYNWYVTSLMTGNKCPRVCIDRIPDTGAVTEPLVPPEPPPEPSPSPTEPEPEPTP